MLAAAARGSTIEATCRDLQEAPDSNTVRGYLHDIWITLHWRYLQVRGSGPRRVAREHLRLERLANFLRHAVEAFYGVVANVHPPNLKSVIY